MVIKAVKFRRDGYYSQPFAFGGEEGMENVMYFSDKDLFFEEMDKIIEKGDVILLKGSRGMAMDKIVSKIMEQ